MKPRVNFIQVMKACWKRDYNYEEYVTTAKAFRIYTVSEHAYEYHCIVWTNLIGECGVTI